MDIITIPITAKFTLNNKRITAYANLGFFLESLVRSGSRDYPIHGSRGIASFNNSKEIHLNFGLITGLGVNVPVKERWQFLIEVRNNLGLGDFSYHQETLGESFALLFGVAYKI